MNHSPRHSRNKNRIIFSTGAFLFLVGFLGMVYNFWINPSDSASDFLPKNTVIFAEFNTSQKNLQQFQNLGWDKTIDEILAKNFPNVSSADLQPWLGKKLALAWLPNEEFVLAGKYRDKSEAQNFMKKFLVAEETLVEKNFAGFSVYSPSFSSEASFVFKDKWLIIASSENALESILNTEPKLMQSEKFEKIITDLPKSREILGYADLEQLSEFKTPTIANNKLLFKALTKTIPALGLTLKIADNDIKIDSKLLTSEGVFTPDLLEKTPHEVVPELAQYAPKDVLFFINGYDLHAKYLHTKEFLEKSHPQFALIFDGVLRAEFKKIFGENFDFQKDLLEKIRGQYALMFNFTGNDEPFPYFTLITKFDDGTPAENSEKLQEIIKNAQQHYSTKIAEHELPDGSVRKELVLAKPDEIKITENSANSLTYFTAETETDDDSATPQQKFSYGFLNGFLVFSNHENGVKDVFQAFTGKANLTQNEDFRESILFEFPASESYGFVNTNKLNALWKISRASSETLVKDEDSGLTNLLKNFRNISFARKTFTEATNFSAILNKR